MKLVVDIDNDLYTRLFDNGENNVTDMQEVCAAVRKGIVIPKEHGRLIDADEFSKRLVNASMFYRGETADMFDTRFADGLKEADIKLTEAPTIIEADKAER